MTKTLFASLVLLLLLGSVTLAKAQGGMSTAPATEASANDDMVSQALNDLMSVKVTTVSKSVESFNKVAASLYVVTAEDIRHSGAMNIPEALRLVPGVDVGQLTSGQYAVSIRGFNSIYSDNLLVLVDGRSLYNDAFGGVYWEDQQMPMSDIDRIEVVRGPGTATWGANAVQVIINIITKSAKDTQGIVATSEYGDATDRDQETVRYGGAFGNDGYYRIYGMSTDLSDGLNANGSRSRDAYINRTGGFRMDEGSEAGGKIQLSGNLYQNVQNTTTETESVSPPYIGSANTSFPDTGGDLMGHWEKLQSNGSTLSAEADYDSSIHYFVPYVKVGSNVQNIDLQDSLAVAGSQSIIFGAGYRNENIIGNAVDLLGTPRYEKNESTYSAFVQDQITISSKISAQIGSKFEHENFTGWEYEPSAHIGYSPDEQHTLWLSASRAVRIPTIADLGATMNAGVMALPGGTLLTEFFTQGHVKDSVIVAAYEAGYRAQVTKNVLFDLSTYYNQYSQLIGVPGYGTPAPYAGPPAGLAVYSAPTELGSGRTYGGEAVSHIRLSPDCRVNLGYSYLNGVVPASIFDSELNAPHSQFEVQAYDNLSKTLELDTAAYFVEAIPQIPVGSYTKLDVRLAYKVNRNCDLSVGGNNLLQNHYSQFGSTVGVATYEAEREFYSTVSWKL